MTLKLRKSLIPLYIVSKILCIHPFRRNPLNASIFGSFLAIVGAIGYGIFHLSAAQNNLNQTNSTENSNLVAIIIDSYNRYSGFCCLLILIVASICVQRKIVEGIRILEEVDQLFESKLSIVVDNYKWSRNVFLQIILFLGLFAILESSNCLMYIQDSIPFSDYCLIMCLVPMFVIGTTEIQFLAYLQLIRNRLQLLNILFKNFRKVVKNRKIEGNRNQEVTNSNKADAFQYYHGKISSQLFANELQTFKRKIIIEDFKQMDTNLVRIIQKPPPSLVSSKPKLSFRRVVKMVTTKNKVQDVLNEAFYRNIDYTDYIIRTQHIYSKLEKVAMLINSSYGLQIVIILVLKFTTLTSLLYFCCMILLKITSGQGLTEENIDQLFSSSGWIVMQIFEVFILSYACSLTKVESRKIGCNLHHFAMQCDNLHCKNKIKAFSMQLLHDRIEFWPLGLFELDLSFLYGLIGAVCTYLIILIQFDLAQKSIIKQQHTGINATLGASPD